MFAKLARSQHFNDRPRHYPAAARPSNDNRQPLRAVAALRQMHRPVLRCRWIERPSGALECAWYVDAPEESAADEPANDRRVALALAVVGQPAQPAAA